MTDKIDNDDWHTEDDSLEADNINPEVPKELWDSFTWKAIKESFSKSRSAQEALTKVRKWNEGNSPKIPERSLLKKFKWALENFDDVPFPRRLGQ